MKYKFLACIALVASLAHTQAKDFFDKSPKKDLCRANANELKKCEHDLQEWEEWGKDNVPKHKALLKDYDALSSNFEQLKKEKELDYEHLKKEKVFGEYGAAVTIFVIALGMGFGIGLLNKTFARIKQLSPSTAKKQLIIQIICAIWITVAAVALASTETLSKHPVNLLIMIFVYSLPALFFGSITLWWLRRAESMKPT